MKAKHYLLLSVLFVVIIAVFLSYDSSEPYSSPEQFCEKQGYDEFFVVWGKDSAFIMYKESISTFKSAFLKKTDDKYVSIGFREIKNEFFGGPNYATIYKGNGLSDHYIVMMVFGDTDQLVIEDSLSSEFTLIPLENPGSIEKPDSFFAVAYVGDNDDAYYKSNYWYSVSN